MVGGLHVMHRMAGSASTPKAVKGGSLTICISATSSPCRLCHYLAFSSASKVFEDLYPHCILSV